LTAMQQQIRFCTTEDGVRLAYASHGRGPAIVKAANWMTHLERDRSSPVWRHWLEELGRGHQFLRYDGRGCGLSDRDPERLSLGAFVADLAAVVDAARLERFALLGLSQGGATAISYAVQHPDRVSHLILCGAYARGRSRRHLSDDQVAEAELLRSLIRVGWGRADPLFRRVFTTRFMPDATTEQMEWFDELQRASATPEMAGRLRSVWEQIDLTSVLARIGTPTLVAHARNDMVVPFEEGRLLATDIPDAHFLPLEGRNHILLGVEPAWTAFLAEVRAFLGMPEAFPPPAPDLSTREFEVLRLVAAGLSNEEIADRLFLSVRTVERHLSNIYSKVGVSGKAARAAVAARFSVLEQASPDD
jgi:pimeloyl-ACP methyl ester carboxylesterase/DNA-binding CsgD family transcriptional regulator